MPLTNEQTQQNQRGIMSFELITEIEWNNPLPLDVVIVEAPTEGSFIELPGPKKRPVRPYLQPFASSGGIAGRVLLGNQQALAMIVLIREGKTQFVKTTEPPIALSVREDGGIWALNQNNLALYDAQGNQVQTFELSGMTLLEGNDNAVWVIGYDKAWYVEANGTFSEPYLWKGQLNSGKSKEGSLCTLEKGKPLHIHCLKANGEEQTLPFPFQRGPFEKLLLYTKDKIITKSGPNFHLYNILTSQMSTISIQNVGIASNGKIFASTHEDDGIKLWIDQTEKVLALPSNLSADEQMEKQTVVAVDGEQYLIYGFGQAWYHKNGENGAIERFRVNETRYENDIFPSLWQLDTIHSSTATLEGKIIMATSGPTGIAIVSLELTDKDN